MDALFKSGIRYLSREEEKYVMAKAIERQNRGGVHRSLDVKDSDYQSLNFLTFVRTTVDHWLALGDVNRPTISPDDFSALTFQFSLARVSSIFRHRLE